VGSAPTLPAGEAIEFAFQAAGDEGFPNLDLVPALPPARLEGICRCLARRINPAFVLGVLIAFSRYAA
jgi:hypothetical protein